MKWSYNEEHWFPARPAVRLFRTPHAPNNVLFYIEDMQGDGMFRLTVILAQRAVQVCVPFSNGKRHWEFSWILRKVRVG